MAEPAQVLVEFFRGQGASLALRLRALEPLALDAEEYLEVALPEEAVHTTLRPLLGQEHVQTRLGGTRPMVPAWHALRPGLTTLPLRIGLVGVLLLLALGGALGYLAAGWIGQGWLATVLLAFGVGILAGSGVMLGLMALWQGCGGR